MVALVDAERTNTEPEKKSLNGELRLFARNDRTAVGHHRHLQDLLNEAADEIERLRAENEYLRDVVWKYDEGVLAVTNGLTTPQAFISEAASDRLAETPDGAST